jgi:hypothetical protein
VPRPLTAPLDRRKMGKSGDHLQSVVAGSWNGPIEGALTLLVCDILSLFQIT